MSAFWAAGGVREPFQMARPLDDGSIASYWLSVSAGSDLRKAHSLTYGKACQIRMTHFPPIGRGKCVGASIDDNNEDLSDGGLKRKMQLRRQRL